MLVGAALAAASARAADVKYVALHGTGTPLGDPIEAGALGGALGVARTASDVLALGSNKARIARRCASVPHLGRRMRDVTHHATTNALTPSQACYGHTEGAAGLSGALLALCALRNAGTPMVVGLRHVNPYVSAAMDNWHARACLPTGVPRVTGPLPTAVADEQVRGCSRSCA